MKYFLFPLIALLALLLFGFFYCYTPISPKKLAGFYDRHQSALEELLHYSNTAVDDSAYIYVHLYPNGDTGLHGMAKDDTTLMFPWKCTLDSLMLRVGLTKGELDSICCFLKAADCIGIRVEKSRHMNTIAYNYGGWFDEYLYGFCIYNSPMSAEEREYNLTNEFRIPYSDRVAFTGLFGKNEKLRWLGK